MCPPRVEADGVVCRSKAVAVPMPVPQSGSRICDVVCVKSIFFWQRRFCKYHRKLFFIVSQLFVACSIRHLFLSKVGQPLHKKFAAFVLINASTGARAQSYHRKTGRQHHKSCFVFSSSRICEKLIFLSTALHIS